GAMEPDFITSHAFETETLRQLGRWNDIKTWPIQRCPFAGPWHWMSNGLPGLRIAQSIKNYMRILQSIRCLSCDTFRRGWRSFAAEQSRPPTAAVLNALAGRPRRFAGVAPVS